ncbi:MULTISPECIES: hypothetical protein [Acidovorax]|uniref:Uncharacterized protein n=1 Tax=Acidovorax carolinensis TaxID=553814 RepID=A0A240UBD7_9BURK|nr:MULTISPECIES: hypothetical protein [Acidovorax]ART47579.1 hypothetical protein CBP33_05080 [Acidovorax carolinensis]ART55737.1 hypothetical protein CBP35_13415 [Acidovorax carolinensis]ART58395.1 hypothetical protein CBP36_05515 [Acidovorax carolinensis]MBP3979913.1 hypothetical protein [Acidovorax sp. JG5]
MPKTTEPTPEQRAQFHQQANDLASQIVKALEGPQYPFVLLEALCRVHRFTALQLPPDAVGQVAVAMAAYAGELMQKSAALSNPPTLGGSSAVH